MQGTLCAVYVCWAWHTHTHTHTHTHDGRRHHHHPKLRLREVSMSTSIRDSQAVRQTQLQATARKHACGAVRCGAVRCVRCGAVRACVRAQSFSNSYITPLFFKMAQNLDLRCVLVSAPWGCWGQNTSRIQNKGVYATLCLRACVRAQC